MNALKRWCLVGMSLVSLVAIGCGSDDDNSGGDANAKAYVASCERLCAAKAAKQCDSVIDVSESDCKTLCQLIAPQTGDCSAKYKAYGDCTDKVADACEAETTCMDALETASKTCGFTK